MKTGRITKLVKTYVAPYFPGYRLNGREFFKEPLEYVMRGYSFESGFGPDMMYVFLVILPLYVQADVAAVGAGSRIFEVEVTPEGEAAAMGRVVRAMKSAEHHVNRLSNPASLAHDEWAARANDEYAQERRAYSLVLAGEYEAAEASLAAFKAHMAREVAQYSSGWMTKLEERAGKLLAALRTDPSVAVTMLDDWTQQSKVALKLVKA